MTNRKIRAFRLSDDEYEKLQSNAKSMGITMSELIRRTAIVELDREIEAEGIDSPSEGREAAEGTERAKKREERLRSEISRLKNEIDKLENENKRAGERAGELEQGLPGLRERHQKLRDRFGELEQRVTVVLEQLSNCTVKPLVSTMGI